MEGLVNGLLTLSRAQRGIPTFKKKFRKNVFSWAKRVSGHEFIRAEQPFRLRSMHYSKNNEGVDHGEHESGRDVALLRGPRRALVFAGPPESAAFALAGVLLRVVGWLRL